MFLIASVHGRARLEFRGVAPHEGRQGNPFTLGVRLFGGAVEAQDQVYEHLPDRWTALFAEMARDWRGWEGSRSIESLEGQLRLSATSDRLGHIRLRVELRGDPAGSDWHAADTLFLDAGQLDDLAERAKAYFG